MCDPSPVESCGERSDERSLARPVPRRALRARLERINPAARRRWKHGMANDALPGMLYLPNGDVVITTDLCGRTYFVTGANSGIGRATADALAGRGGSVVLASRSEERTRPVLNAIRSRHGDADVEFVPIDLA